MAGLFSVPMRPWGILRDARIHAQAHLGALPLVASLALNSMDGAAGRSAPTRAILDFWCRWIDPSHLASLATVNSQQQQQDPVL